LKRTLALRVTNDNDQDDVLAFTMAGGTGDIKDKEMADTMGDETADLDGNENESNDKDEVETKVVFSSSFSSEHP
jgi:hypothetical protein